MNLIILNIDFIYSNFNLMSPRHILDMVSKCIKYFHILTCFLLHSKLHPRLWPALFVPAVSAHVLFLFCPTVTPLFEHRPELHRSLVHLVIGTMLCRIKQRFTTKCISSRLFRLDGLYNIRNWENKPLNKHSIYIDAEERCEPYR